MEADRSGVGWWDLDAAACEEDHRDQVVGARDPEAAASDRADLEVDTLEEGGREVGCDVGDEVLAQRVQSRRQLPERREPGVRRPPMPRHEATSAVRTSGLSSTSARSSLSTYARYSVGL